MINVTIVCFTDNSREVYYVTLPEHDKLTPQVARQAIEAAGLTGGLVYWQDKVYKVTPGRVVKVF